MDLSSRESILAMIEKALGYGEIKYMVNGAGVSPSQIRRCFNPYCL